MRSLLPDSVAKDPEVAAVAAAIEPEIAALRAASAAPNILGRLGDLARPVLDEVARYLGMDFYDPTASNAAVLQLIMGAFTWHRRRGTVWSLRWALEVLGLPAQHEQTGGGPALYAYPFRLGPGAEVGPTAEMTGGRFSPAPAGVYGEGELLLDVAAGDDSVTLPVVLPVAGAVTAWLTLPDFPTSGDTHLMALGSNHILKHAASTGRLYWADGVKDLPVPVALEPGERVHVALSYGNGVRRLHVRRLGATGEAFSRPYSTSAPVTGTIAVGIPGPQAGGVIGVEGLFVWETPLSDEAAEALASAPSPPRPYPPAEIIEPAEAKRRAALRGLHHVDGTVVVSETPVGAVRVAAYALHTALPPLMSWAEYIVAVDLDGIGGEAWGPQVNRAIELAGPAGRHAIIVGRFTERTTLASAVMTLDWFAAALGQGYGPPRVLPTIDGLIVDGTSVVAAVGVYARPLPPPKPKPKPRGRVFFPSTPGPITPVRQPPDVAEGKTVVPVVVQVPGPPGPAGPEGPEGQAGEQDPYYHVQGVAASTWTIHHGLDRSAPPVVVVDSAQTEVEGAVTYPDADTVVITFSAPFSGVAYVYP